MIEIKKKSIVPVYGVAAAWILYCMIFPLYKTWHFIALACSVVLVYTVFSLIFPDKVVSVEVPEEPERSGDEKIDALLEEGEKAVSTMRGFRDSIPGEKVKQKIDELISITDKIFKKLLIEPGVYKQIKRFSEFFLPTTIKLLSSYDRFGQSGVSGENINSTIERIDAALDTTKDSYAKFYDSLFENQALDIEADIRVLETMLKKDGLMDPEF